MYSAIELKKMDDVAGRVVLHALFDTLKERSSEWIAFFGMFIYMKLERRLAMRPDNSTDWWFSTDMLWLVSIVYSFYLVYHSAREQDYPSTRGTLLVKHTETIRN